MKQLLITLLFPFLLLSVKGLAQTDSTKRAPLPPSRKGVTYKKRVVNLQNPEHTDIQPYSEGLACFCHYRNGVISACGYMNEKREVIIPARFKGGEAFKNGYAKVLINYDTLAYINKAGELSQKLYVYGVQPFYEGLAVARDRALVGYIDYTGKFAIPCEYEEASSFINGLATAKKGGFWGIIDTKGKTIVPFEYEEFQLQGEADEKAFFAFKKQGKWGIMNIAQKVMLPPKYVYLNKRSDHTWLFQEGNKYGLLHENLQVLTPAIYDNIGEFTLGFASVMQNYLFGTINWQGKLVVPCRYDQSPNFYNVVENRNEVALAIRNNKRGIIDTTGREWIPCIYDELLSQNENSYEVLHYDVPFYAVRKDKKAGVVNQQGQIIIPIVYDAVSFACKDLVRLYNERDTKCGWATLQGKILVPPSLPTKICTYPEYKLLTYPTTYGCEEIRKDRYPCDAVAYPCYQCEMECPDDEWLRKHGYKQ